MDVYNVATQGRYDADQWVTSYALYRWTGSAWALVGNYTANSDRNTIVLHTITGVNTRYLRFVVTGWSGWASMRFGVNVGRATAEYNTNKFCRNSEITLTRPVAGSWTFIPGTMSYLNDLGPNTSSFSPTSNTVIVTTNQASTNYEVGTNNIFLNRFIQTKADARVLPVITVTTSPICRDGSLTLSATGWGTQLEYDWRIYTGTNVNSPIRSSTQAAPTIDFTGVAPGKYYIRYRVREQCCGWSRAVYDSLEIREDPTAPTVLNKLPNVSDLCAGATLTLSGPASGSTGGGGTCVYEYRFRNPGQVFSAWSTTIPSFVAAGNGLAEIEARYNCGASGCDISPSYSTSWDIVPELIAGGMVQLSPTDTNICEGAVISAQVVGGSGGTGTITDEIQWRLGTSGPWNNYTGAFTATAPGQYFFRTRRTATGNNCITTAYNPPGNGEFLFNVVADPTPQDIHAVPSLSGICGNEDVSATFSGGSNSPNFVDQYQYRTKTFGDYNAWLTYTPGDILSTALPIEEVQIRTRRYDGTAGCDTSAWNTFTWVVTTAPGPNGPITGYANVCNGAGTLPYSIGPVPNAGNYIWGVWPPASGALVVSGQGTQTVDITFNGVTPAPGYRVFVVPQRTLPGVCNGDTVFFTVNVVSTGSVTSVVTDNTTPGDWYNAANWVETTTGVRCVPTCGINATVSNGNTITLSSNGQCRTMTLSGNLNLSSGSQLDVCVGNFARGTGTLTADPASVLRFTNSGALQQITGVMTGVNALGSLHLLSRGVVGADFSTTVALTIQRDLIIGSTAGSTDATLNGATVNIGRDLRLVNGSTIALGGRLTFDGADAAVLDFGTTAGTVFRRCTLEKTGLTPTLTLQNGDLTIANATSVEFRLGSGRIITGPNKVFLNRAPTLTTATNFQVINGWIEGTFERTLNSTVPALTLPDNFEVLYPVGNANFRQMAKFNWGTGASKTTYSSVRVRYKGPFGYTDTAYFANTRTTPNCLEPGFAVPGLVWEVDGIGPGAPGTYRLTLLPRPALSGGGIDKYTVLTRPNATSNWAYNGNCDLGSTADSVVRDAMTTFSEKMATQAGNPLPVELLTFTARPKGNAIELNWQTARENLNQGFQLQKGTRATQLTNLAWVPSKSAGANTGGFVYDHLDAQVVPNQVYYYRLIQMDVDGSTHPYNIVQAHIGKAGDVAFTLYPNPARSRVMLSFLNPGAATELKANLVNSLGQTVFSKTYDLTEGFQQVELDIADLADGSYNLVLWLDGQTYAFRLVKQD